VLPISGLKESTDDFAAANAHPFDSFSMSAYGSASQAN
jgi:hypothetical protein